MPWTFVSGALLLSVLALAFALIPLLREGQYEARGRSRRATNRDIHADRMAELDQDLANGTLTREQYDQAVADLERDLVQSGALDSDGELAFSGQAAPGGRRVLVASAVGVAVALPLVAAMLYLAVGDIRALPQSDTARASGPSLQDQQALDAAHDLSQFDELAAQLQKRLEAQPEDVEGWTMLGRTYAHLQQFDRAREAFAAALAHGGDQNPDLLAEYADLLADHQGDLSGEPEQLVSQALELDPDHVLALWLAGTAAFNAGEYDRAREHWEHLLGLLPEGSETRSVIRANLEAIDARREGG
ncbi:MAG: c-type cytochrome biogenesis protein CcmI [Pseudomonadota bacterium]